MSAQYVWLRTSGSGEDGDEWIVHSIHNTEEGANDALRVYERLRTRSDGTTYCRSGDVEKWEVSS